MKRKRKNKRKNAIKLIAHSFPKSPITEQYRLIRTNIHFSSVDKEIKTILVTSPEPADGKSTTAANLAIVLSQQGKRVVIVDADLRKSSVHYAFNVSNMDGLTSVLTRKTDLNDTIIKSYIPNLEILTAGPVPPNPSELLNSEAMEIVLAKLYENYDYIVFDSPPVLAVSDAQILANKCDGVVLVIASGKTRKDRAIHVKDLLLKAKSHLLGVVVNGVETKPAEYYKQYK